MLQLVDVGVQSVETYEASAGRAAVEELRALAAPLRGLRVLHLNATPYGGGVAEILRSEIPLLRDLGLIADWRIITGDQHFFTITKLIHNGLQGATPDLTGIGRETYLTYATRNAHLLDETYDLIVVHDPQPLPVAAFHGRGGSQWIWRCHIDTAAPNPRIWEFLRPYLTPYDAAVFTLGSFVPDDFPPMRVEIIPPAIDPESPKNLDLDVETARRVLQWIGIDINRPLITQISRFDPWKDPLGVIAAYHLIREEVPGLQLALVGSMALDDPGGWEIYQQIEAAAQGCSSIRLFTNLTGVGNIEVNAFQRLSNVVIQKSIREGFGLVVSEALWKETPVVAGRAGGIPLQLHDGQNGFLVDSVDACAEKTLWLLRHPREAAEMGAHGRTAVRDRYLLTRLIADELRLYQRILEARSTPGPPAEIRDPVCGRLLTREGSVAPASGSGALRFCSPTCRDLFAATPERFRLPLPGEP